MIPGKRVTDESHCLPLNNTEKCFRTETRNFTLFWFPSPVQEIFVLPPMKKTVSSVRDCCTAKICIQSIPHVWNPLTLKQVATSANCKHKTLQANSVKRTQRIINLLTVFIMSSDDVCLTVFLNSNGSGIVKDVESENYS